MGKQKLTPTDREKYADDEYARLISLYKVAGADDLKIDVFDRLIRKVAELYATLEAIKDLPTIRYNAKNHSAMEETAAGKVRVKYMAQYTASMLKLSKALIDGYETDDDDGFDGDDDDEDD